MAYEKKEGSGSLFKNDRKEKETHPDYKGDALVFGKEVWLSGWIKKGKNGSFLSIAIKPKEEGGKRQGGKLDEDRDSIPF